MSPVHLCGNSKVCTYHFFPYEIIFRISLFCYTKYSYTKRTIVAIILITLNPLQYRGPKRDVPTITHPLSVPLIPPSSPSEGCPYHQPLSVTRSPCLAPPRVAPTITPFSAPCLPGWTSEGCPYHHPLQCPPSPCLAPQRVATTITPFSAPRPPVWPLRGLPLPSIPSVPPVSLSGPSEGCHYHHPLQCPPSPCLAPQRVAPTITPFSAPRPPVWPLRGLPLPSPPSVPPVPPSGPSEGCPYHHPLQ